MSGRDRKELIKPIQSFDSPAIQTSADAASGHGQRVYVSVSATRLIALIVGAIAAAAKSLGNDGFDFWGLLLLISFAVAAIAEFWLLIGQPERNWYSGRAIAESIKTLAWRYAVQGAPFGANLTNDEAEKLLRLRIREVVDKGKDHIELGAGEAVLTDSMRQLRAEPFDVRRTTYLDARTKDQRKWYSDKAKSNARAAGAWRLALLVAECLALIFAANAFGHKESIDVAGLIAVLVASGAAWLAIKQFSQLTSAYRVAATELALQEGILANVDESVWDQAVADAEEAISREHTMWLASRGPEKL
jgi:hypothetical protein